MSQYITIANALTVAILSPVAVIAALFALKLLRAMVERVNAQIRAQRKPACLADWSNDCPGVDVLGDGGREP